jgi:short-subunit dehydrogenase
MTNPHGHGTALITGASTGIGAVYADRLANRGYDLILVARDKERLDVLATKLTGETGAKVNTVKADLTDKADLSRIEQILRTDSSITMLVNNAGISVSPPFNGSDLDETERLIQLNIVAVTRLAGAAVPNFVGRGSGIIVNISSVLAVAPEISGGAYSGSKAYLLNFTLSLNQELAKAGIQLQVVLPGATRTEIWERSGMDLENFPPSMLMEADVLVDAALAGLDNGELVTVPSLPDMADWEAFNAARLRLGPNLSRSKAAARYTKSAA